MHPELSKYVVDLISSLKDVISSGEARQIALVILNKDQHPLERFVFELGTPNKSTLR